MVKFFRIFILIISMTAFITPESFAFENGVRSYVFFKKSSSTRPSAPPTQEEESITCTIYDDGYVEFGLPFNMYTVYVKFINPEGEEEVEGFVTHRTDNPAFIEWCASDLTNVPSRNWLSTSVNGAFIINKSESETIDQDCSSLLIGDAFNQDILMPVTINSDNVTVSTNEITILPCVEINNNTQLNLTIK